MAGRIRRALTFANVCSFLALTIALGTGGAYAANTVFSTDIVDGEVKNADIGGNQVTTTKIKAANVMNTDIGPDAVDGSKILDAAIAHADIAANAVDSSNVLNESLTSDDLASNSVQATEIADSTIDSGEIVNDSLFDTDLATGSVRSPEILDGAVANADLASNSVTASKVTNNSLTTADILGADTSGTVNLNGVPNGRCTQVTFSVGAAQPGEVPLVATKAAIQNGIVIQAQRVSSAGSVNVNVCNLSGAAMTPITNLPVRVITFG